ncbi:MAG TPA: Mth938-like domain-containing protein [Anaerolineaceae bacterium]
MGKFYDPRGPIEAYEFGKFIIRGEEHSDQEKGVGKDIRLIGDKVTRWKERKGHRLYPQMITGVDQPGLEILIIGTGHDALLEVPKEVIDHIKQIGIHEVICLSTMDACQMYNQLFHAGKKIALLAHGTC